MNIARWTSKSCSDLAVQLRLLMQACYGGGAQQNSASTTSIISLPASAIVVAAVYTPDMCRLLCFHTVHSCDAADADDMAALEATMDPNTAEVDGVTFIVEDEDEAEAGPPPGDVLQCARLTCMTHMTHMTHMQGPQVSGPPTDHRWGAQQAGEGVGAPVNWA
jgi:hypothetical protein